MSSLSKILSMGLVVAILLGITLLAGISTPVHANGLNQTSPQKVINWESVVAKANPYIHIVNGSATIDPQLNKYVNADELALVQQSITRYNNLPLTLRQHPHLSGSYTPGGTHPNTIVGGYKSYRWAIDAYWWGVRMWINTYAAQNFNLFLAIAGGGVGAAIGGIIGTIPGAIIGAIAGAIVGSAASWVDNECGQRGVFIDINWLDQVSLNPVC